MPDDTTCDALLELACGYLAHCVRERGHPGFHLETEELERKSRKAVVQQLIWEEGA